MILEIGVDGELVADGLLAGTRDDHRLRPAAELAAHVGAEVLDDHRDLLRDVRRVQPYPGHDLATRLVRVDLDVDTAGVILVREAEGQAVWEVVLEHVEDEALLDGLLHRVQVEGALGAGLILAAEQLDGLALRRRGERDEGDRADAGLARHDIREDVLRVDRRVAHVVGIGLARRQDLLEGRSRFTALRGVRFVGDDRVVPSGEAGLLLDDVQRMGECLQGHADDLLPGQERIGELLRLGRITTASDRLEHA